MSCLYQVIRISFTLNGSNGENMKKLIFCFDGTCNEPETFDEYLEDNSITNILKLHAMFGGGLSPLNSKNAKIKNQQSYYYSGVGTRGNWLSKTINSMFAPQYGDIDDILDEAFNDLKNHKNESCEIYVFGFSRGAAIARMFAAKIEQPIRFIGVFDTVAATRGSLDMNPGTFPASGVVFENGTMAEHIKEAVHILALDEKRVLFQPTLFNKDERITEVWFPGVHSDIGGGYWYDGLSDITLKFMIDKVSDLLTVLEVQDIDYERLKITNSRESICRDDLNIKPLAHGKMHLQSVESRIDKKLLIPRVPRVNINDQRSDTSPIIHHTVVERFNKVSDYRPYALRDTEFRVMDADGNISKSGRGISDL